MTTTLPIAQHDPADEMAGETPEPTEVVLDGVSRRTFMSVVGASAALAGVGLSGCIRKPVTKIVPYQQRPEDLVEGVAMHYASAYQEGATIAGIIVEAHEGRPTKIAGNPAHPDSQGATNATTQASVLALYDLDRSVLPHGRPAEGEAAAHEESGHGKTAPGLGWEEAWRKFDELASQARSEPVAFVVPSLMSPTMRRLLVEARGVFPKARFFRSDLMWPAAAMSAAETLAGAGAYALAHFDQADVIAAFDCDFLGGEPGAVRATKGFSQKRRVTQPNDSMNRLYVVEPSFSGTGAMADHRLRVKAGEVGAALGALARALAKAGVNVDAQLLAALPAATLAGKGDKYIGALAADLSDRLNGRLGLVLVGVRQPAWVHALAYAINAALGAPQSWHQDPTMVALEDLAALAQALTSNAIETVFALDTNPAFTSPGALGLATLLEKTTLVHASTSDDETGRRAALHLPVSHYLEAWGDLQSLSGAVSIQQPLIDPLHHTPSTLEVLGRLVRGKSLGGHDLVRETWKLDDASWEMWLHDGVKLQEVPTAGALDFAKAAALVAAGAKAQAAASEIIFELDPNLLDGRYANSGWLRELPHPMAKLTWDNAALMNKATAGALKNGDIVTVTVDGKSAEMPVQLLPGVADGVVVVALGNGRRGVGKVAEQHGFDTYPILPAAFESAGWFAGGSIAATGDSIPLANLQKSGNSQTPRPVNGYGPAPTPATFAKGKGDESFEPRLMALSATLAEYRKEPDFPDKLNDRVFSDKNVKSWMYPERPGEKPLTGGATTDDMYLNGVHQWGMSIDLNACTGCNACTIACQAENNIVVVGKQEVLHGREMHWIRLDRYFSGNEDEIEATLQPLPCQQCETAPCEAVCPVKATAHSNEGLNDMVYNRCIGTRYCLNNCPFKVRRFNWFNFNLDLHPLEQMQKNPDVTVRFRGVMEKCTYCIQRINRAKIDAKVRGNGRVQDGAIETACQEVCPADAIVFGDLRDTNSAVVKAKSQPRTYQLLRELNMRARTTYLAKLKNPNPNPDLA